MKLFKKGDGKITEFIPGFHGRFIHTGKVTIAHISIIKGAVLPLHSHLHEQTTQLISGHLELVIDGKVVQLKAGDVVHIPAHVEHSGTAIEECVAHDVFIPEREDYMF